jgi:L-gamma-glutamyl-L-propargylglycine hydroxylase
MAGSGTAALDDMSTNDSPIFTLFDTETARQLTREHILRLSAGVLGAVRIREFSAPEECARIVASLDRCDLGAYDERLIYPRITKLGPAAYDFYGLGTLPEAYWKAAAEAREARSRLLDGGDPMDLAVGKVRAAWQDEVRPATSGGRALFAGMIREITYGAKLHFDEIVREFPGVLDETPASFLTLNWYFSMPEGGGETRVYRRRWRPADEMYRDGYGYTEEAVAGEPVATVRPETGDIVLFDSRNLHSVAEVSGAGRRVSLSFFLGITGRGPLAIWS